LHRYVRCWWKSSGQLSKMVGGFGDQPLPRLKWQKSHGLRPGGLLP